MVVTLGEIMLRLSPEGHRRFSQAEKFEICFGGGEANVALSLALLGEQARFITKLPENEIAECALHYLRGAGVDVSRIVRGGERLGIYFYEHGASVRGGKVVYDRKHSAFASAHPSEFDLGHAFEGADHFHITGITPALGESSARLAEEAMRTAKRRGMCVSFDPNYRAGLWTEEEAKACFGRLLPLTDVLIGSSDGLSLMGLAPTGTDAEKTAEAARKLCDMYPFRAVALTMRGHISASENTFSAVYFDGDVHVARTYHVCITDRVGAGDAFAAGLIFARRQGMRGQRAAEFATAAGALKHTVAGDGNLSSKEEILALMQKDGGRVSR